MPADFALSPDGDRLAVTVDDRVNLWDVTTRQLTWSLQEKGDRPGPPPGQKARHHGL